jgi:copper chaperone CopZ
MMKKLEIQILGIKSFNDKIKLETEVDVLEGVKDTRVNEKTGILTAEFDDALISKDEILKKIKELGYQIKEISLLKPSLQEFIYYVKGMHCASCELLIENELLKINDIKSVEASLQKGTVRIVYQGERPKIQRLNSIFKKYGYTFSEEPTDIEKGNHLLTVTGSALLVIVLFFLLKNSRFSGLVNVSSNSSLPTFFLLGLIAGVSSCAALVGGLLLSMAKQWSEIYSKSTSALMKLQPYLLFNFGRILSYGFFGGIIGLQLGQKFSFLWVLLRFLILLVSLLMIFLGLQMLGVRYFSRFQIKMPKFITRKIADGEKLSRKIDAFFDGRFNIFSALRVHLNFSKLGSNFWQFLARSSNYVLFCLRNCSLGLLAIGFSSVKFLEKPQLSDKFLKVAGILVLFFAFV